LIASMAALLEIRQLVVHLHNTGGATTVVVAYQSGRTAPAVGHVLVIPALLKCLTDARSAIAGRR
jgi:hypothetical protein